MWHSRFSHLLGVPLNELLLADVAVAVCVEERDHDAELLLVLGGAETAVRGVRVEVSMTGRGRPSSHLSIRDWSSPVVMAPLPSSSKRSKVLEMSCRTWSGKVSL